MNLFYRKKTLNNNLVGVVLDNQDVVSKNNKNATEYLKNDSIVGFNIELSKNDKIPEGRLYPTNDLIEFINSKLSHSINIEYDGFVVGEVIECDKIPDTHLSKTKVDINSKILDIVCGASNVKKGLLVAVATIGTLMPSGLVIKPSKLKGFDSNGMLCSQKELNLVGFNENGIIELDNKYKKGDIFKKMYANL